MEGLGLLPEALLLKSGLERRKSHQSAARPGSPFQFSHALC